MRTFKLEFDYTPLERLQSSNESISEMMSAGIRTVGELRDKLLEALPDMIRGLGSSQLRDLKKIERFTANQVLFTDYLKSNNYASLRLLKATTPEGMTATYMEYLDVLEAGVAHMKRITSDVLQPYVIFLAQLVSSKDAAKSYNTNAHIYTKLAENRSKIYSDMSACFSKSHDTRTTYGDVVDSNAAWAKVIVRMNKLTHEINSLRTDEVTHLMKQADDYLKIIHGYIEKEQLQEITPETSKSLSEGAYQVGLELEFYSIIYYRVLSLGNAINQTMNDLNRILSA